MLADTSQSIHHARRLSNQALRHINIVITKGLFQIPCMTHSHTHTHTNTHIYIYKRTHTHTYTYTQLLKGSAYLNSNTKHAIEVLVCKQMVSAHLLCRGYSLPAHSWGESGLPPTKPELVQMQHLRPQRCGAWDGIEEGVLVIVKGKLMYWVTCLIYCIYTHMQYNIIKAMYDDDDNDVDDAVANTE